jgi:hypothetical protein
MDNPLIDRLWKFSYVLMAIIVLWGIWIFGFIWFYYDDTISFVEGGVLIGLSFIMIAVRESALTLFRKETNKYR